MSSVRSLCKTWSGISQDGQSIFRVNIPEQSGTHDICGVFPAEHKCIRLHELQARTVLMYSLTLPALVDNGHQLGALSNERPLEKMDAVHLTRFQEGFHWKNLGSAP